MQTKHLTMKHKLLSFYLLAFVLLSDFRLFAQVGDESDEGNLQDDDAPQAPINGKLMLLAITGLAFAFYVYRRNQQAKA